MISYQQLLLPSSVQSVEIKDVSYQEIPEKLSENIKNTQIAR